MNSWTEQKTYAISPSPHATISEKERGAAMSVPVETIKDAVKSAKENAPKRNFVESIDLIVNIQDLDLDNPKNRFDTEVRLPNSSSKQASICVIGEGDLAIRAERAGADLVIGRNDLEQLASNPKRAKEIADNIAKKDPKYPKITPIL